MRVIHHDGHDPDAVPPWPSPENSRGSHRFDGKQWLYAHKVPPLRGQIEIAILVRGLGYWCLWMRLMEMHSGILRLGSWHDVQRGCGGVDEGCSVVVG